MLLEVSARGPLARAPDPESEAPRGACLEPRREAVRARRVGPGGGGSLLAHQLHVHPIAVEVGLGLGISAFALALLSTCGRGRKRDGIRTRVGASG